MSIYPVILSPVQSLPSKSHPFNSRRMKSIMNEQEVCSTMHGFAKMSARWDDLSDVMRRSMLVSIASLASVGALCLACTIYSLGMLGATWDRLPYKIRECFMNAANQRNMQDQTISNVVYGLSLLKASWATLEPEFRDVLLLNLAQEDAFLADVSQVTFLFSPLICFFVHFELLNDSLQLTLYHKHSTYQIRSGAWPKWTRPGT
jgi:hypothetical protein